MQARWSLPPPSLKQASIRFIGNKLWQFFERHPIWNYHDYVQGFSISWDADHVTRCRFSSVYRVIRYGTDFNGLNQEWIDVCLCQQHLVQRIQNYSGFLSLYMDPSLKPSCRLPCVVYTRHVNGFHCEGSAPRRQLSLTAPLTNRPASNRIMNHPRLE